jgi:hypothetical protein
MKVIVTLFSTLAISLTAFGQTISDQIAGLQKAGIPEIESNFYMKGNIGILLNADGSYQVYAPYDDSSIQKIEAMAVTKVMGSEGLGFAYKNRDRQMSIVAYTLGGSGGAPSKNNEEDVKAAIGKPGLEQVTSAGFKPIGNSLKIFTRKIENTDVIVFVERDIIVEVFKPIKKRVSEKLKGTVIDGYKDVKQQYFDRYDSAVIVKSDALSLVVSVSHGGDISSSQLAKDLNEISLETLGGKAFQTKADITGFNIGGTNPVALILKLVSINGLPIGEIENNARKVDGCADGDSLLADPESILQAMAEDNEKVTALGLTHQEIGLPLQKIVSMVNNGFGYEFVMNGNIYNVDGLMSPMCGSLESPFNDGYSTRITFPRITNQTTKQTLKFSYLHPYLIHQYGFYGSHRNKSYVSPESIVEILGIKKK